MRRSAPTSFGSIDVRPPLALRGQRIGLLGGSFNPPHEGHRLISEIALRRLQLDQLWWLVTPGNPLKSRSDLDALESRLAACRALASDARIVTTAFEVTLPTAYTAATLAFLRRRYPGTRFVWVMGADNLPGFHRWQHWRSIFAAMPIAVVDRPGYHLRAMASKAVTTYLRHRRPEQRAATLVGAHPPAWTLLTGPLSDQSSTALRAAGRRSIGQAPLRRGS
jgi:nicotinate-nucleotide adenylyltransferase